MLVPALPQPVATSRSPVHRLGVPFRPCPLDSISRDVLLKLQPLQELRKEVLKSREGLEGMCGLVV